MQKIRSDTERNKPAVHLVSRFDGCPELFGEGCSEVVDAVTNRCFDGDCGVSGSDRSTGELDDAISVGKCSVVVDDPVRGCDGGIHGEGVRTEVRSRACQRGRRAVQSVAAGRQDGRDTVSYTW